MATKQKLYMLTIDNHNPAQAYGPYTMNDLLLFSARKIDNGEISGLTDYIIFEIVPTQLKFVVDIKIQ